MDGLRVFEIHSIDVLILISLALPLVSFLFSFFVSERYSWAVPLIATLLLFGASITTSIVVIKNWEAPLIATLDWFSVKAGSVDANLLFNNRSLLMWLVVVTVSFLVHLYSVGYMAADMNSRKYFGMLGLFTFSMLGIVLSDNILSIYLFWELVGFSSYVLIGHYSDDIEAGIASRKAFIINRIGDCGFVIAILILWSNSYTLNLSALESMELDSVTRNSVSLLMLFAVIAKSAQFPLFTWLPQAMKGPTPVSALLHAATMVAAGVYLLIRIHFLFTDPGLLIVSIVGATTTLIGALSALAQFDIKKILAYSTVSQLGLMLIAVGAGSPEAAFLHLFTHATFKACLFLCAGAVIHALHHAQQKEKSLGATDLQDIRNLGGLAMKLPGTFQAAVVSGAALAGIPFTSGFLSKEAILTTLSQPGNIWELVILVAVIAAFFITTLYTFRFIWQIFLSRSPSIVFEIPDTPIIMRIPIMVLAFFSLWFTVSVNPFSFNGWFYDSASSFTMLLVSIFVVIAALIAGWGFYRSGARKSSRLLREGFYLDSAYDRLSSKIVYPVSYLSRRFDRKILDGALHLGAYTTVTTGHIIAWVDKNIVDGLVHLVAGLVKSVGAIARSFQGGKVQLYIFWALFAVIIFLIWTLI